jgi:hypothetical protein
MSIKDMTIGQFQELQNLFDNKQSDDSHPWQVGGHYVIRTVTMIQSGVLKAVYKNELLLEGASWIADTGRFHDFLLDPASMNECEPFTADVIVGRGSVIDAQIIPKFKPSKK